MIDLFEQEIECPASQYILGSLGPDTLIVRSRGLEPVRDYCRKSLLTISVVLVNLT
jgi:hypothetical protein